MKTGFGANNGARTLPAWLALVLLVSWADPAQSQTPVQTVQANPTARPVRPLELNETRYSLRAGEPVRVEAPAETVAFVRTAKTRRATVRGTARSGFVLGPNVTGDGILLAASLTMPPGDYIVDFASISETGEERVTTLAVTLNPPVFVPSTATQPPVILLNGWQIGFSDAGCPISASSADTFGNLQTDLLNAGVPVVYFFDNCAEDANAPIEKLGSDLLQFFDLIKYDNGTLVPHVDLVAHSMGGLIARSYLAGLQSSGASWILSPPPNPRVRKLIEIATPNFGSFLAANYSALTVGQSAEMIPGSSFLWNLATWNQFSDDLRGVDALAIIGNLGSWTSSAIFPAVTRAGASDGVVSLTSASLGFVLDASRTRILPYCHIDSTSSAGAFETCTGGGIASGLETALIVLSFLSGGTGWQSIGTTPNVDPYGGMYFAYFSATDTFLNDVTGVLFGATAFSRGGDTTNAVYYDELVPAQSASFQFQSTSAGSFTYGPVTVPAGYYSVIRSKSSPVISSVSPLLPSATGRVVQSGGSITITGVGFGQTQCAQCRVLVSSATQLPVSLWSDQVITASLPSGYNGAYGLSVQTASGQDYIVILAAPLVTTSPVTIQTIPAGLQFSVDGAAPLIAPQTLSLTNNVAHTISVATSQPGSAGTQYGFVLWSDGGAATHSINVTAATTYTAIFQTQYQLTTSASPAAGGSVTPGSGGYYSAGSAVPISASLNTGYSFTGWTGNVASAGTASTTVTMSAPESVTANFAATASLTIQTNPSGLQFSIDSGTPLTAPQTLSFVKGSMHAVAVVAPQPGAAGTQYAFTGWSDGGAASHSFTVNASGTLTASFQTQYQLTLSASPIGAGTVTPASGAFYNSGVVVPVTATANSGYSFTGWTGNVANVSAASTTVTMGAPQTVTANFLSTAPTINAGGIVPLYSSVSVIQPGSWISIYGTNLANTTAVWNGTFTTSLGGVSVMIDNEPGYLWSVTPGQINLEAPDDMARGTVNVTVTTPNGTVSSTVTLAPFGPSFSLFSAKYPAGVILTPNGSGAYDGGVYDLLGPSGAFSFNTRPVKAGETLELYGVGFGPTNPPVPAGAAYSGAAPTANTVTVTIGGVPANVLFSGITTTGLYQFNIAVPNAGTGDQLLQASVNGVQTPAGVYVTLQ